MAATYDFEIEQGADLDKTFTWKDSAGAPVSLVGYTARMQVRKNISAPEVLLSLTTENSRISIDGAAGQVILHVDAATTSAITWTSGVYDIELISGAGKVFRLVRGTVTVSKEVTR